MSDASDPQAWARSIRAEVRRLRIRTTNWRYFAAVTDIGARPLAVPVYAEAARRLTRSSRRDDRRCNPRYQ